MTKTEARKWLRRIREDAREIEAALLRGDWAAVEELANDASGAACEISSGAVEEQG